MSPKNSSIPIQRDAVAYRDFLRIFGPAIVLAIVAFVVTYQFVDPTPPRRLTIATASADGAYFEIGEQYRAILARDEVELEVRVTNGSVENIALLESPDSGVDVALVQGGTGVYAKTDELRSLGSLFFEPIWLLHPKERPVHRLTDLAGKKVWLGPTESGTRALALELLKINGLDQSDIETSSLPLEEAVEAVGDGRLDALFAVRSATSAQVREVMVLEAGIKIMSFERAEAYTRRLPYLSKVLLPEGVLDMAADVPRRAVILLAPAATLVARSDLHPALIDLLLQAAAEVHSDGSLFAPPDTFPAPRYLDFPLSKEARRYYESGAPFLRRVLPFWAATLLDRMKVLLVPLIVIVIPLFRVMPPIYRWRIRSRVYRWYEELNTIENAVRQNPSRARGKEYIVSLQRIEDEVQKVQVPWSYAEELYQLRVHIQYVEDQVNRALNTA